MKLTLIQRLPANLEAKVSFSWWLTARDRAAAKVSSRRKVFFFQPEAGASSRNWQSHDR
ncbi:MAG: hypothetical protein F6K32_03430 [Desertifilum sp. SIO1I2]|nr:hypothetical protein [Desertifilum sp. SIO1I2]